MDALATMLASLVLAAVWLAPQPRVSSCRSLARTTCRAGIVTCAEEPPEIDRVPTMSDSEATAEPPRQRRIRYSGTNPRKFEDKYKEQAGDDATVARVLLKGGTPAGMHVPIMAAECLAMWKTRPVGPARAAQAADWPRLAGAWGSLRRALAQREASGDPAGRVLRHLVFHIGASHTSASPMARLRSRRPWRAAERVGWWRWTARSALAGTPV